MIKIKELRLSYNSRFSLYVEKLAVAGGIFTIIGPNGAGKTTLLNIIGLFEKAPAAQLEVLGRDILQCRDTLSLRRMMAVIFSHPYLLDDTVTNNIALPLRLRGVRDRSKVAEMCELFKITHLKSHNATRLSHGEMHRVALARAFVVNPRLILMDEPFLGLDPGYKKLLIEDLHAILKLNKTGVVFITQDHFEALSLADELAVMSNGMIVQRGSPVEVFTRPVSKDIADFIGMETIAEGKIISRQDNLCSIKVNEKIIEAVADLRPGDNVLVCIRPEDVIISMQAEATSARNCFKAAIVKVDPWLLEYKLTLDCGFSLISFVTKQSIESLGLYRDRNVFVTFKATAVHLIKR